MSSSSEYKIGYKVLSNKRLSVVIGRYNSVNLSNASRLYLIHKEVKPKPHCGPLCVFMNLHFAKSFRTTYGKDQNMVVKCKYKLSKRNVVYIPGHISPLISLPKGTVLADSVICLE